jgi:nucleoside-diphosphate-sugar epimerase
LRLIKSRVAFRSPTYTGGSQITKEGALNIVRQAVAAGVKHVSFTGTVGTIVDFTNPVIKAPLSDKEWNPLTEETVLASGNGTLVYTVAKTKAEQALWKFAEEHPELNLTTSTSWIFSISRWCP